MKLLVYIVLFYLAYRLFVAPLLAGLMPPRERENRSDTNQKDAQRDDDYIDYEEI